MIKIEKTPRNDYEITDDAGKCLGHIWKYEKQWVIKIGGNDSNAEYRDTYLDAVGRAKEILNCK